MLNTNYYKEKFLEYAKSNNKIITEEILSFFNTENVEKVLDNFLRLENKNEFAHIIELMCEDLIINSISKIERSGMKLGLHRMEKILTHFGNPEKHLRVIHIAGTNGKGSVSSYITTTLSKNYKIGMYSSPGMISFNDRIRINENFISYEDMYILYKTVENTWFEINDDSLDNLSFFEILTTVAILYFSKKDVDFVVMEVGLGGRYDATNVFNKKELSIITKIGFDHTDILGDTLQKIAYEKAGIIAKSDNIIMYPANKNVEDVIYKVAKNQGAILNILNKNDIDVNIINLYNTIFSYKKYKNINIKMLGDYQIYNAALAIMAIDNLRTRKIISLTDSELKQGIENTVWAGRLEWLKHNILIDGAHNIDGVTGLINYIKNQKFTKLKVLLGILKDKDYKEMIKLFEELDAQFFITNVPIDMKGESVENLKMCFSKNVVVYNNYEQSVNDIYTNLEKDEILLVSGSLYLISAVRKYILKNFGECNE